MRFVSPRSLAAAAALVELAACSGGASSTSPAPAPVSATPMPVPASTAAPGSKAVLRGLVTMGAAPGGYAVPTNDLEEANAHPGIYSAAVVNLYWSQLEPAPNVFDDSALTAALATIGAYDAKYPATPLVAKLRIRMGAGTPAWVIQATGAVTATDPQTGDTVSIGEFWTPAYRALWQGLQAHLAAEYDGSAAVGEVAITSCSSLTGEPFILPHGPSDVVALHAAGYTDALGMACLSGAPADYAAWTKTPLDYTFNPFFSTDGPSVVLDTAFPVREMAAFRNALGERGVVANHGLQSPMSDAANPIYAEFGALEAAATAAVPPAISPLEFQTVSPTVDWPATIALGLTYAPTEIEIWDTTAAGGQAPLDSTQLSTWAADLK